MKHYRTLIALLFASIFHILSLALVILSGYQFYQNASLGENDLISAIIKSINTLVISLAMYELGAGIGKEYRSTGGEENVFQNMRRTITRFVGTACIALVLEALFMIIKYS
ncbi:MAG: hypothetical protein L0Y80_05665 [Ignavibacteriae bacterium]|nr:hypothetical protein [Ignavibacteriota bacterium]